MMSMMTHSSVCSRAPLALAAVLISLASAATPAHAGRGELRAAKSWAYQLQGNVGVLARSAADVVVIDAEQADIRATVARLKHKPAGGRRQVIAYLSIGEAERWRSYWKTCCANGAPGWLTTRTQGWADNYAVRYWDPGWKAIVMRRLEAILAAGFDGVYLDRADTWQRFGGERSNARASMIGLIKDVAARARARQGDFGVVVQNAEELLADRSYVATIDAVAKEDLFHGIHHDGRRNASGEISGAVRDLKRAQAAGKTIFVVEYLHGESAERVRHEIRAQGFIPFFGPRDLAGQ